MIDTIGINIEFLSVLKTIVTLIDKGFPHSIILFSQRPLRDFLVLAHFMITDIAVCPIVPSKVYDCENFLTAAL